LVSGPFWTCLPLWLPLLTPLLGGPLGGLLHILDIHSPREYCHYSHFIHILSSYICSTLRMLFIRWDVGMEAQGLIYFLYICPGSPLPLDP
jgi:hypothetical protein